MNQRSYLASLPEYIVAQICRELVGRPGQPVTEITQYDTPSVASLCLTSNRLNIIATPVLYSRFLTLRGSEIAIPFLRTISQPRRNFGEYVRELGLYQTGFWGVTQVEKKMINKAATRLKVKKASIDRHEFDTIVQLILAYTPLVRCVQISTYLAGNVQGRWGYTILQQVAARVPRRVSLEYLGYLSLTYGSRRYASTAGWTIDDFCLQYFAGILELAPRLHTIQMNPSSGLYQYGQIVPPRISLENVTSLSLAGKVSSIREMAMMVGACGQLKSFRYNSPPLVSWVYLVPRDMIQVLLRHKDTLLDISISLEPEGAATHMMLLDETSVALCKDGSQILSLKDFSRLESLEVDGYSILFPKIESPFHHKYVLTDMLPRSIKRFCLTTPQKESVANIDTVADAVLAYSFPALRRIRLIGSFRFFWEPSWSLLKFDEEEIEVLRQKLLKVNVNFEYVDLAPPWS
ncbi:hypothetical protein GGI35DRAFT_488624 [Trichoderma velutinum]